MTEEFPNPQLSWIVCWTITEGIDDLDNTDHWQVFESHLGALAFYGDVRPRANTKTASLCAVAESTDYDAHPLFA